MTSPLTSGCLDRLSVWTFWTHYAVDDYVIIWSNSDKNCQRRSILKGVTSQLWRHGVTTSPFSSPGPLIYRLPSPQCILPTSSFGFWDIWPQSYGHTHIQNL